VFLLNSRHPLILCRFLIISKKKALFIPKLQSHFAEFFNIINSSALIHLYPPTCDGLRTINKFYFFSCNLIKTFITNHLYKNSSLNQSNKIKKYILPIKYSFRFDFRGRFTKVWLTVTF